MRKTYCLLLRALILGGIALFAACSGPQIKTTPMSLTANPSEEAAKLETELANARQQQINILAPTWFAKADSSLNKAKELISARGAMSEIASNVSKGRAEIDKAKEMAEISRTAIPDAIKGRKAAREAGATMLGDEYSSVEERFLKLTREIEANNLNYAQKNQEGVVEAFRAIEIKAIKENTLGEVRKLLDQAEDEGAEKLAPKILADARNELKEVDDFISKNPYAREDMNQKARSALFGAKRALQLTRQSKRLKDMRPIDIAMENENTILKVSQNLGATDMRDQPFETQVDNIVGTASSVKTDRDFLAEKSNNRQLEIEALKKKLSSETAALNNEHTAQIRTMEKENEKTISSLKAKYDAEVEGLVKQVAALEGKSREEQNRIERMMAEQRAEREKNDAEQRSEKERLDTERRMNAAALAVEKKTVEAQLAAERRFNDQYDEVQSFFTANEAECYKQGNKMVIRLRGMGFPVGQAIIMPENYALLSKVQRAVRTFDNPNLTIEGHTDTTGTLEMNKHLSQQRAEAVREYLLANGVTTADKITAVGYGPSRPLAPNTTVEGRTANRRIDMIITPRLVPPTTGVSSTY